MSAKVEKPLCALPVRLVGPLQSYGASSVGGDRPTEDAPTKSAMVGMVGAALGIDRSDVPRLLALDRSLLLVVRIDEPGVIGVDYHTAQGIPAMDGSPDNKVALTRRSYLEDASFTVLLIHREGAEDVLAQWHHALRYPRYAPTLGRRACPPAVSLVEPKCVCVHGERWTHLLDAVAPWESRGGGRRDTALTVHVDEPLCSEAERAFGQRIVRRDRLVGPGPRRYFDRTVFVCRWERKTPNDKNENDTTEGWL